MEYHNWVSGFKGRRLPHDGAIGLLAPIAVLALNRGDADRLWLAAQTGRVKAVMLKEGERQSAANPPTGFGATGLA